MSARQQRARFEGLRVARLDMSNIPRHTERKEANKLCQLGESQAAVKSENKKLNFCD